MIVFCLFQHNNDKFNRAKQSWRLHGVVCHEPLRPRSAASQTLIPHRCSPRQVRFHCHSQTCYWQIEFVLIGSPFGFSESGLLLVILDLPYFVDVLKVKISNVTKKLSNLFKYCKTAVMINISDFGINWHFVIFKFFFLISKLFVFVVSDLWVRVTCWRETAATTRPTRRMWWSKKTKWDKKKTFKKINFLIPTRFSSKCTLMFNV